MAHPKIVPVVTAIEHVRGMRGGSQAHLMKCSDGRFYVVKFANNPQNARILTNELLASQIAAYLKLPVPRCAIVDVPLELIERTKELVIITHHHKTPCQAGLAFGSRYIPLSNRWDTAWKFMATADLLSNIENLRDFMGMLVFDKWTGNTDGRQVVFVKRRNRFRAFMIDNGFCFNAGDWNFPDSPIRGLFSNREVYRETNSISQFKPWLTLVEEDFNASALRKFATQIPKEWIDIDRPLFEFLLWRLDRRRARVRELVFETLQYLRTHLVIDQANQQQPQVCVEASSDKEAIMQSQVINLGDSGTISLKIGDIRLEVRTGDPGNSAPVTPSGYPLSLAETERIHINQVLEMCGGNLGLAALKLGIGRTTLYRVLSGQGRKWSTPKTTALTIQREQPTTASLEQP
jgi:HipA-like protein/regulatory Fis family protein